MRQDKFDITNKQKADINKKNYKRWKEISLSESGYYPIFQPFKETHLLRNLSGNAVKLYIYLGLQTGNDTGETWVSIETMAKYFGKSERTINDWLKELRKVMLIERFQLKPNDVAHTFLIPYGGNLRFEENSMRKDYLNSKQEHQKGFLDFND